MPQHTLRCSPNQGVWLGLWEGLEIPLNQKWWKLCEKFWEDAWDEIQLWKDVSELSWNKGHEIKVINLVLWSRGKK